MTSWHPRRPCDPASDNEPWVGRVVPPMPLGRGCLMGWHSFPPLSSPPLPPAQAGSPASELPRAKRVTRRSTTPSSPSPLPVTRSRRSSSVTAVASPATKGKENVPGAPVAVAVASGSKAEKMERATIATAAPGTPRKASAGPLLSLGRSERDLGCSCSMASNAPRLILALKLQSHAHIGAPPTQPNPQPPRKGRLPP